MNALVIDTETTGRPLNYQASIKDVNNWPRITQIAWEHVNIETGEILNRYQSLVYPDGWEIPKEDFFLENNMSTERCMEEGIPLMTIFNTLLTDMNDSDFIVCHNINFDRPIIGCEMVRYGVSAERKLLPICTMLSSTDFCQLPGKYGYKWPSLVELHTKLFNCSFDGNHDAMADVSATTKCFLELIRLGVLNLD